MTPPPSADQIREIQRKHWNAVAPGWEKWADWTDRNFAPIVEWLRQATGWQPGSQILDVACGSGFPAIEAARAVRPGGHVSAVDVSPDMLAAAARRAHAEAIDNLQFFEMDAEDLQFADRMFDAAICTCGLMFYPDPTRALSEMRRVLKPEGRAAVVVWDEPERNPFSTVIVAVLSRFISMPPTPAGASGPFRFAPAGALESVLHDAGFSHAAVEPCVLSWDFASPAEYLAVVADVTGWKRRIDVLPNEAISELTSALADAVQPYVVDGRLRISATALCARAQR